MPERAEIERLNRALDNMRAEYMAKLNAAEAEIVALRAARSPQGEDDLRRWLLRTVGSASSVRSAKRVVERLVADALGRSPQGEDHELARRAAHEAADAYVDAAGCDLVDTGHVVDEALAAYLSRCPSPKAEAFRLVAVPSPSRDGTVAVEPLREAARKLISVYMADGDLDAAMNELEAAAGFSQQGAGESNEGGNQ